MKKSLAKQDLQRLLSKSNSAESENHSESDLINMSLMQDLQNLSKIQSAETRNEYKKKHIHQYETWTLGAITKPNFDKIAMQMLVWSVDCDDYSLMLRILPWAIANKHPLPENFVSTALVFVIDEICDKANVAVKNNSEFSLAILEQIFNLSVINFEDNDNDNGKPRHHDMPDIVLSKLYKAIGLHPQTLPDLALESLKIADQINTNSGVKNKIKKLEAQLLENNEIINDIEYIENIESNTE